MARIGPIPPKIPSEPNEPRKKETPLPEEKREPAAEKRSTHSRKLQRFANVHPSSASLHRLGSPSEWDTNVPIREEWNVNKGYCGECDIIAAGMVYGQYCSQSTARELAWEATDLDDRPDDPQQCQLLLGDNDAGVAAAMKLAYAEYPGGDTSQDFLVWVKQQVMQGHGVSIGLFMNQSYFYQNPDPAAGDTEYDHIVSVTKIVSSHSDGLYHGDDVIYFSDNGLSSDSDHGTFHMTFDQLLKSRADANANDGPIYSLRNDGKDYGMAVSGTQDPAHETLPVRVDASQKSEPQPPAPIQLTVAISNLTPGQQYVLYQYDDFSSVPASKFNGHASSAKTKTVFTATGSSQTFTITVRSDQTAVFRAVPVSGS
jgi:hypothetical protein